VLLLSWSANTGCIGKVLLECSHRVHWEGSTGVLTQGALGRFYWSANTGCIGKVLLECSHRVHWEGSTGHLYTAIELSFIILVHTLRRSCTFKNNRRTDINLVMIPLSNLYKLREITIKTIGIPCLVRSLELLYHFYNLYYIFLSSSFEVDQRTHFWLKSRYINSQFKQSILHR